jgi:plasmid stability protein
VLFGNWPSSTEIKTALREVVMPHKSSPVSLRLDDRVHAKLVARAGDLDVSTGALARSLITSALESEVEMQLEGIGSELGSLQTAVAVLGADLRRLNGNLHGAVQAVIFALHGEKQMAEEIADEVVQPLDARDEE